MATFVETITKLLCQYKLLLKRHLATKERSQKLASLGLGRKSLKHFDEIALYHKAHQVINDLENWIANKTELPSWHSGIDEFCRHLKNVLSNYRIEGNKIIHLTQATSNAVIQAIQIISFNKNSINSNTEQLLDEHLTMISKYGSEEQKRLLLDTVSIHTNYQPEFFKTLLNNLQSKFAYQLVTEKMVDNKAEFPGSA